MKRGSLRELFSEQLSQADDTLSEWLGLHKAPVDHYRMIRYHLGIGSEFAEHGVPPNRGKRLRPVLSLLTGAATGATPPAIRTLMAAAEMMHGASLVHDDIQDRDPVRWDRPTVWKKFGVEQAINVGDAMIGLTYQILSHLSLDGVPADRVLRAMAVYSSANVRMAEGQHLDLAREGTPNIGFGEYLSMIEGKTGAACECACHAAAVVGTSDASVQENFRQFASALGIMYQICDDIRGMWGRPEDTGKKPLQDLVLRKSSLPLILAMEQGPQELREVLRAPPSNRQSRRSDNPSEASREEPLYILHELQRLGIDRACQALATRYRDQALRALERTGLRCPETETLQLLTEMCAAMARVDPAQTLEWVRSGEWREEEVTS